MNALIDPAEQGTAWPWDSLPGGRWIGRLVVALLILFWVWALATWPLTLATALLVGVIAGVPVLLRPALGLPLLAIAIPFGSLRTIRIGPAGVGLAEILLGVIAVAWLLQQMARRRLHIIWPAFALPALLFLGVLLASFLPATSLVLGIKDLLKWVELWVAAVLVVNLVDRSTALLLVLGLLGAGAAEGLLGLYQFLMRQGPEEFLVMERFMRAAGTFGQPNPYGGYLGLTLPLAIGILLTVWPRIWPGRGAWRQQLPWLAAIAGAVLTAGGLIASWSRGAWLGAAAAVVAVVGGRGGRWLRGVVAVTVVGVLLCLATIGRVPVPEALAQRFSEYATDFTTFDVRNVQVTDANFAVVERIAHWQAAWGMFSDHPWTGVGLGNYTVAYEQYALPNWPDALGHAHNYYLHMLAEVGLPGLAAYLLWLAMSLWVILRALRAADGLWRGVALGALGMWVHLAVHSVFDNLYVHAMSIQLGLLLGLAAWIAGRSWATTDRAVATEVGTHGV